MFSSAPSSLNLRFLHGPDLQPSVVLFKVLLVFCDMFGVFCFSLWLYSYFLGGKYFGKPHYQQKEREIETEKGNLHGTHACQQWANPMGDHDHRGLVARGSRPKLTA